MQYCGEQTTGKSKRRPPQLRPSPSGSTQRVATLLLRAVRVSVPKETSQSMQWEDFEHSEKLSGNPMQSEKKQRTRTMFASRLKDLNSELLVTRVQVTAAD